ncbi:hypothetical protein AAG570_010941 [Ranatra chinensis]|uniref:Dehydrogenase/reductase SDR family member 7 n=1 Tax=Ranatra chinensis TaxID=642074 RepID=A0ABD0Z1E2_9HEMI
MDFFTLVGLLVTLYLFVYIVSLAVTDCDLGLLWASHFREKPEILKGKVVWITGASSGIGAFLAVEMAKNGAKVVLSGRSVANLKRVRENCIAAGSNATSLMVLPFDVTDFADHERLFLQVVQHFGKLDILVNNAGRSQRAIWENIELDVDKEMFDLNVFSVISLSRIAVNYFEKQQTRGHLVVMSSLAGVFGAPFSGTYTATKHAIHGYFKSLMTEKLGGNIDVTLLCPGPVFSNLLQQCFTSEKGKVFGQHMRPTDKRMPTERCAQLCAIAIANKLDEAWIGIFPVVPLCYVLVYFPNIAKKISIFVGAKQIQDLRDSRQTIKEKPN